LILKNNLKENYAAGSIKEKCDKWSENMISGSGTQMDEKFPDIDE
jgi:hypothetical protein